VKLARDSVKRDRLGDRGWWFCTLLNAPWGSNLRPHPPAACVTACSSSDSAQSG